MLIVPEAIWAQMLDELARHAPGVERVAYLDGYRLESSRDLDGFEQVVTSTAVVTTIALPDAELHTTYFRVSAAAMSRAGAHLRRDRMARLAQVHTHGDNWLDHSPIDDEDAYSQRIGSLSFVLPKHAELRPTLHAAGVHVRERSGWRRLTGAEITESIHVVPSIYDFRERPCLNYPIDTVATQAEESDRYPTRWRKLWNSSFRRR